MATTINNPQPTDLLKQTLAKLRAQIRGYVAAHGTGLIIVWLTITFWCALGLDYLPVRLGLTDLPRWPRVVLLAIIVAGTSYLIIRFLYQRLRVRLDDQSLALLLERRHDKFQDAFVTAIEFAPQQTQHRDYDPSLVEIAQARALEQIGQVRTSSVLNMRPLWIVAVVGTILLASVVGFAIQAPDAFSIGIRRLYLLDSQTWPRLTMLTRVGATLTPTYELKGIPDELYRPEFESNRLKVGIGSTLDLWVRAAAPSSDAPQRQLPASCSLRFRSSEGDQGRVNLDAEGSQVRGEQTYRYSGKPFEGLLSDLRLDLRGGDDRITRQVIEVVENPTLTSAEIQCVFPDYMVDWESGAWTPRTIDLPTNSELPFGTQAVFRGASNKPLARVFVHHLPSDRHYELTFDEESVDTMAFEIELPELIESDVIEIALLDQDGVLSANKFTIELTVVDDQPPEVSSRMQGIGAAVTPRVRLPMMGEIKDDYGVDEAWIEVFITEREPQVVNLSIEPGNRFAQSIDFEQLQRDDFDSWELIADSGQTIQLTTRAVDRFNLELKDADSLSGQRTQINPTLQQTGSAESIELRVVSESELLRILERAEVGQRKRLEQIYKEMGEAQLHCLRTRISLQPASESIESNSEPDNQENDQAISEAELKPLLAQRARMQTEKSWRELDGIVQTFRDIRLQLENNRVDAEDRKRRLEESVAAPLQALIDQDFPQLITRLEQLECDLADYHAEGQDPATAIEVNLLADETIDRCQKILSTVEEVLTKLAKYESYGELLDLFRDVIREQEYIMQQTDNERKKQGLDDLFGR